MTKLILSELDRNRVLDEVENIDGKFSDEVCCGVNRKYKKHSSDNYLHQSLYLMSDVEVSYIMPQFCVFITYEQSPMPI